MSPRSDRSPTARDKIIRSLTPSIMRAFNVDRETAKELLATRTPECRNMLWVMRATAISRKMKSCST